MHTKIDRIKTNKSVFVKKMDSKMMFASVFVAQMQAEWNAYIHRPVPKEMIALSTTVDRIQTYKRIICAYGTKMALEKYMRLIIITKGDLHTKQELMDEFRHAY